MLTTVEQIFDVRYSCSVPKMAMRSIEEVEQYGTVKSGDARIDAMTLTDTIHSALTINEMVEVVQKGFSITFYDQETVLAIYRSIQAHLQGLREYRVTSKVAHFHQRQLPVDDIGKLDDLARKLHATYPGYFAKVDRPDDQPSDHGALLARIKNTIFKTTTTDIPVTDNSDLLGD